MADRLAQLHMTVITGMSGAGKSEAVATFEDMGYFCIDNLPPQMMERVVELFALEGSRVDRVALVFDVRGRCVFRAIGSGARPSPRVEHPLPAPLPGGVERGAGGAVPIHQASASAVARELARSHRAGKAAILPLREQADVVIDTSGLTPGSCAGAWRRHSSRSS